MDDHERHTPSDPGPAQLARALRRRRTPGRWVQKDGPIVPEEERRPIVIGDGSISTDTVTVAWYSAHVDDVLVAFLEVVRRSRGDDEAEVTGFRRIDIDVLAEFLEMPGEIVVEELALLVGASSKRGASMKNLYRSTGIGVIPTGVGDDEARTQPSTRLAELLHEVE
ncbi:MAG: hypothetical protein AAF480_14070 [Actinomycetota bacterium]